MANAIRKRISKKITKALHDFKLIEDGDKVLVAVSGGKDSSVLLMELAARMGKFLPDCEIGAIHIQSDFADKAPRDAHLFMLRGRFYSDPSGHDILLIRGENPARK